MTPKEHKWFIHTHKTVFTINIGFKHLNFGIKGGIIHSIIPLSFQYYYVIEICTQIFVGMK